jgi:hypothetical protein
MTKRDLARARAGTRVADRADMLGVRNGLALALGAFVVVSAAEARAELRTVLAGRATAVVAAGDGVAVVREGEVALLDANGRLVATCRGESAWTARRHRVDGTALAAEEVLDEAGFPDEDESIEAADVLDDEGIEPPSRHRPVEATSGAPRALAIAGAADGVWIGTSDGLWRLDAHDRSCAPVGLGGQELTLVAAAGATVVAISDTTVWRSRDAGVSFEVAAVLDARAHALALAADGETTLVADEEGVVALGDARRFRRVLEERVDALATCGAGVVALAESGVVRIDADPDDDASRALGPRPPARALACAPAEAALFAVGVGLWSSADGARWREDDLTLGRSFSAVARAAGRTWLAGDDALFVLAPAAERAEAALAISDAPPPRLALPHEPPAWAGLLPRVAIAFDGWTESTGVAGWRLWVLLTVSLGQRWQRTMTQNLEELR